jgi:hypothetical protein
MVINFSSGAKIGYKINDNIKNYNVSDLNGGYIIIRNDEVMHAEYKFLTTKEIDPTVWNGEMMTNESVTIPGHS